MNFKQKCMVIIMIIFLVSISAYAESNSEILFRDIPWGITLAEYVEELENQGFYASEIGINELYGSLFGIDHPEYFCSATYGNESMLKPICKVAGYDVYAISVYAICEIEGSEINTDYLDSLVFGAAYTLITVADNDAIVNDLREKLSYLYGPERTRETGLLSYYWQGQNETEIELTVASPIITLEYTDKSIENHLKKLNSIVYEGTANLDGL